MERKTAFLAGATGLVGSHVLTELLHDDRYEKVVALSRRPVGGDSGKLETRIVDFDDLERDVEDLKDADVYCCLGTTMRQAGSKDAFYKVDYQYPYDLARLARDQKAAAYLLVTAVNANRKSPVFYSRVKGEIERDVAALGIPSVHFFRPSFLIGNREDNRPGEKAGIAFAKGIGPFLVGPVKRLRPIEAATVAKAMIAAAHRPETGVHIHALDSMMQLAEA